MAMIGSPKPITSVKLTYVEEVLFCTLGKLSLLCLLAQSAAMVSMRQPGLTWCLTWPCVVPNVEHLHEQQLTGRSRQATEGRQNQPLHCPVKDGPVCSCACCQDGCYLTVRHA